MVKNILSYFTKDIIDPHERAKYLGCKDRYIISIYYNLKLIWEYDFYRECIVNHLLEFSKNSVYNENKIKRYFNSKYKYINQSNIVLYNKDKYQINYRMILKSYFIKSNFRYIYLCNDLMQKPVLLVKISYFNNHIYKYIFIRYKVIKYYRTFVFIPDKYELRFYSNIFICYL